MIQLARKADDKNTDLDQPKYLKVHPTLTKRWSLSRSTIYQLMDSGKLSSVKVGASRRIPIEAVIAFEAELAANGQI